MSETTRGGRWTYRAVDQHSCPKPTGQELLAAKAGDVWECNCGLKWRIDTMSYPDRPAAMPEARWVYDSTPRSTVGY